MRFGFGIAAAAGIVLGLAGSGIAGERYSERPPVVVSPDLTAPWVMQLTRQPVTGWQARVRQSPQTGQARVKRPPPQNYSRIGILPKQRRTHVVRYVPDPGRTAAVPARPPVYSQEEMRRKLDPKFYPRVVDYSGPEKPGTIVIDSASKFLYLIEPGGKARRYGVGVGKEGFGWTGTETITRKAEWPEWRPPAEMRARERAKGRELPVVMAGGLENPLGARALYLGDTLYRIHGTNAPWTIGSNVSSGCIRMRNEDVIDLYERVGVGTKVIVR